MRSIVGLITGGGVAAFFFFSWVIQALFNSIVVDHFGLLQKVTYWQAAGMWFLIIVILSPLGLGVRRGWKRRD